MSSATARRILIYFLIDVGAISAHCGASYMVEASLKHATVEELLEEMQNSLQNDNE